MRNALSESVRFLKGENGQKLMIGQVEVYLKSTQLIDVKRVFVANHFLSDFDLMLDATFGNA